jgi:hypothetical protein
MNKGPAIYRETVENLTGYIRGRLGESGWVSREKGPGEAVVRIFGRLAELIVSRLNQLPEKHFLSFLEEGGIDILPPGRRGG